MQRKLWNVALMLDDNINTCEVYHGNSGPYTYAYDRTLRLIPENHVVVENANGYRTGKVTAVHDEPDIDPDASFYYALVVCRVTARAHEKRKDRLAEAVKALARERRRQAQQQAIAALGVDASRVRTLLQQPDNDEQE